MSAVKYVFFLHWAYIIWKVIEKNERNAEKFNDNYGAKLAHVF